MGDYEKSFSLYKKANQALYRFYEPQFQDLETFHGPAAVRRIENAIPGFDFSARGNVASSPVFLIGFPRSGTTLLDQILSSHSQITVLEEKQNLDDAFARFPATDEGLKKLENASDPELQKLRKKYWARIKRELGSNKATPHIVDKYPLNAIALLHISRLFPDARIIVALRDPRDCVFSCYQQRFGMNQAMFQMLDLDTAVSYYEQVMNVVVGMRDSGALPMHFIRYENVIEDFRNEIAALTEFLELEWEEALLDYQTTAKSRQISTPSARQVIQPLYTSSIGKWKHYRQWVRASFDPLDPLAEEWGYERVAEPAPCR
jgi:tetratricopeptide (TPR) repeat protein